jgi:regulator of protease activity HflC (stomatin/prohibitin superfamily)
VRRVVLEGHEHLIIRRVGGFKDPHPPSRSQGGAFFLIRAVDAPVRVDMRPHTETVEQIKCFSQDGVDLDIGYSFQWKVDTPLTFSRKNLEPGKVTAALKPVATETLLDFVRQMSFQDVLQKRQNIVNGLRYVLQDPSRTKDWGIEVFQVSLGEIKVPPHIAEAMARQAVAHLVAQARTVEAKGTANDLKEMQGILINPNVLDRAVLLQIMRSLSDAIAQRK